MCACRTWTASRRTAACALEELASLPVLFETAEGDAEMAAQASSLGGIDYVTKPIRFSSQIVD
jgi:PleD family two-component response regulator